MWPIIYLYTAAVAYSSIRYIVFAPKNMEQLPVFVVSKGVSMAAAFCFALAFWLQWRCMGAVAEGGTSPRRWFRAGLVGVFLHVPMSLAILTASYFPEFFHESGRMSFRGEAVFLFGALTVGGMYLLTRQDWTLFQRWALSAVTMTLLFAHTLFMGISRGLNINASHAYLPPMWLLSLIGIGLGLGFVLMDKPNSVAAPGRPGN